MGDLIDALEEAANFVIGIQDAARGVRDLTGADTSGLDALIEKHFETIKEISARLSDLTSRKTRVNARKPTLVQS